MSAPFWYIIVNPAAGNGAAGRLWPRVEQLLQELGFSYTVKFTNRPGHAPLLVEDAVRNGHRHILGLGGDGTNHELVNGILRQQEVGSAEIRYALLPVGTGNDWARMYKIPRDPRQRLLRLLEGRSCLQDVGLVRYTAGGAPAERYFANVAGMAYDAFLVQKLLDRRLQSHLQYLLAVAQHLMEYRLRPARLLFDNQTVDDSFYTINVGICPYSGGGMRLVPHAVPDDGLLAVTYARALPKWEVLLQTRRFYDGSIIKHPRIGSFQTSALRVEQLGPAPTLVEADGEFLGETPVAFSIVEKALQVVF